MPFSLLYLTLLGLEILVPPVPAYANAGLVMIAVVWPPAWLLFFPIVLLEAEIARRRLALGYGRSLLLIGSANLLSMVLGFFLAWLVLIINEVGVGLNPKGVFRCYPRFQDLFPWIAGNPWLPPDENAYWQVPIAGIILCIPFLVVSVFVESSAVASWLPHGQQAHVRAWSWRANTASCVGLVILLLVILGYAVRVHCKQ